MRVFVVLVNYNGWRDTVECLESLSCSTHPDFRVIVCDNGSTDGSIGRITAWAEARGAGLGAVVMTRREAEAGGTPQGAGDLVLIDCGGNLGFAGGNNVGLRYALAAGDCDLVWLLNNDTAVHPDAMGSLVRRLAETPRAGLACSTLVHYHDRARVQALGGGWYCAPLALAWHLGRLTRWPRQVNPRAVEAHMSYPVGASLMVTRPFLEAVGLLCEDYFLYFEELDWMLRNAGRFGVVYAPDSLVYHKVGGSIGTSSHPGRKSYLCDYWSVRNRIFFTRRWFPWALPTVYLALCATLIARILLGRWDRVGLVLGLMAGGWRRTPAQVPSGRG